MTEAQIIFQWENIKKLAESSESEVELKSGKFAFKTDKGSLKEFSTLDELGDFASGYDFGYRAINNLK